MQRFKKGWKWSQDQPGAIVVVLLLLAFALFFPHEACRGSRSSHDAPPIADHVTDGH